MVLSLTHEVYRKLAVYSILSILFWSFGQGTVQGKLNACKNRKYEERERIIQLKHYHEK